MRVYASTGQKAVLPHLVPQFERASGIAVSVIYGSADTQMARIAKGEAADLYICNASMMDDLAKQHRIVMNSRRELARGSIGVAVRAGARRPDIDSVEAFRQAMRDAQSIAYSEIGASGIYFAELIERLGIAAEVRAKEVTLPDGLIGYLVVEGKAELVVQHLSELIAVPGLDIVGPLPPALQKEIILAISIAAASEQKGEAQALLEFLTSAAAAPAFEANGYRCASSARGAPSGLRRKAAFR